MALAAGKVVSLPEAVRFAEQARSVALGGWGFGRRPCGAVLALLAAKIAIEELIVLTAGIETDLLLASDRVGRVRTFYCGLEALGAGPGLRRGALITEETETSLILGLMAAAERVSFLPLRAKHAEALRRVRPDLLSLRCPYTGEEYVAVPAIAPDVAYLHAWRADPQGNVVLGGHQAADRLLAAASRRTVVTCEEVVPAVESVAAQADIVGALVDAVVHVPGGARPTSCPPVYAPDFDGLTEYTALEASGVDGWVSARAAQDREPRPGAVR